MAHYLLLTFPCKLNSAQKQKCAQHICKTRKCVSHSLQENQPTACTESSSEANRSRASQEIPQIFGTVLHSQQHATWPYPEPDQSSPCNPSNFLKIHFNNIPLSMPRSYRWPPSLQFPHQNPVYISPLPICAACPAHSSLSDPPNNIRWVVQIMRFLITWTPAQTCVTIHPISPCLIR